MENSDVVSALSSPKQANHGLLSDLARLQGLDLVESRICSKLSSEAEVLSTIGNYLFEIGGKRIRPILAILSARACGLSSLTSDIIDIAAGVELIHMATLLHDDIIDKSPLRRHKESPLHKYGSDATLLAGDFLLTRAFGLCARLDRFVIEETEVACVELTEGEVLETPLYSQEHSIDSYLTIARKKTASLFRLAATCGAHLAGSGTTVENYFRQFGEDLGVAFQILDDVLDVCASEESLGKQRGIDIRERKPSIVNLLWLETGSPLALRLNTKPGENEDKYINDSLSELQSSHVIQTARELASMHAEKAKTALLAAAHAIKNGDGHALDLLKSLLSFVTARNS